MIELILFLAVGAGLLVLLVVVMRRPPTPAEGSAGALVAEKHSLQALQAGLLSPELIERIFGTQDSEYVSSIKSSDVRALFLAERRRLALSWIGQIRRQIRDLKEFHIRRSRLFAEMSRRTEFSVALEFASLQMQCGVLQAFLQWRGPHAAPRLVRRTATAATGLCEALDRSLAFLTPGFPVGLEHNSGENPTAIQ